MDEDDMSTQLPTKPLSEQEIREKLARDILALRNKIWANRPPLPEGTGKQWIIEEWDRK